MMVRHFMYIHLPFLTSAAGLGACGITNNKTDFIVAVSTTLFDTFPFAFFSSLQ